jgi:hypothetical protein
MLMQALRSHANRIAQAAVVAAVPAIIAEFAPAYARVALWAMLPIFAASYFFVVPWLWRRYPVLKRFEP